MFDLARYLAGRLRTLYPEGDLETVCRERGFPVLYDPELEVDGLTIPDLPPGILLRPTASPRVHAHETFHAWVWENTSLGIEYTEPTWNAAAEEDAADQFAAYVAEDP